MEHRLKPLQTLVGTTDLRNGSCYLQTGLSDSAVTSFMRYRQHIAMTKVMDANTSLMPLTYGSEQSYWFTIDAYGRLFAYALIYVSRVHTSEDISPFQ